MDIEVMTLQYYWRLWYRDLGSYPTALEVVQIGFAKQPGDYLLDFFADPQQ
jgi:hypothetical protein